MNDFLIVGEGEEGTRLDKFLISKFPQYSRTYFQSLIEKQLIVVNGELIKKGGKLNVGDEIEVEFSVTPEITLAAEPIPLDILYEDEHLLAINKPVGMVVHPAVGNWNGTFVNALLYHCEQLQRDQTIRPGIVHRLDKETSGVLLAAKDESTQRKLVEAFALRQIEKEYRAICFGNPGQRTIVTSIGRHPVRRKEMAVVEGRGREAKTICDTLLYNAQLSLVRLIPYTGRTHQLRVHMQFIGTPILGDPVYGSPTANKKYGVTHQLLHAYLLRFAHPVTQNMIELKAPIPPALEKYIQLLQRDQENG